MNTIKKFIIYSKSHGLKKALARSFLELGKMLDVSLVQDQIIPPPHPIFTSSVHVFTLFAEMIRKIDRPKILEVGSRAVTKDSLYQFLELGSPHQYTGLDIHDGPNVDKVGDAHELSTFFPQDNFDVIMSKSVFEHLAMPWKVVLEMNTVLKQNGLLFIHTLHTFPLHEKPWDFWRFSDEAWKVLLNRYTGFEIIESGMEYPCRIAHWAPGLGPFPDNHEAYLNSNVLARKIGPYDKDLLKWNVSIRDILESNYPKA